MPEGWLPLEMKQGAHPRTLLALQASPTWPLPFLPPSNHCPRKDWWSLLLIAASRLFFPVSKTLSFELTSGFITLCPSVLLSASIIPGLPQSWAKLIFASWLITLLQLYYCHSFWWFQYPYVDLSNILASILWYSPASMVLNFILRSYDSRDPSMTTISPLPFALNWIINHNCDCSISSILSASLWQLPPTFTAYNLGVSNTNESLTPPDPSYTDQMTFCYPSLPSVPAKMP